MKFVATNTIIVAALLAVLLVLSYFVHDWALNLSSDSLRDGLLIKFYVTNWLLASLTSLVIIWAIKYKSEIAGFSFMGGSLVKFAVFFAVFYPFLSEEKDMRKLEILGFYVPYALCLIVEVWYLIRKMNRLNG